MHGSTILDAAGLRVARVRSPSTVPVRPPAHRIFAAASKGGRRQAANDLRQAGHHKGTDTAKLDPLPDELPKTPAPPPPPRPPEPRGESPAPPSPDPRGTTVDVNLNGRTWRVELDPVPIATGAGLALLLALLALWPKRKDVPTDADQLARLGIECHVEPDLGEQAVTHLERPPVGPRITVRATPGSRRHGIVMR